MAKRKLAIIDDFEEIEATGSASIHGVCTAVSPVKKGRKCDYFDAQMSDSAGRNIRLVGFKKAQQMKLKEIADKKKPVHLENCEVKPGRRGGRMELLLKGSTAINVSPRKIVFPSSSVEKVMMLEEIQQSTEYDKVTLEAKVVEVSEAVTVATGKRMQEILIADANASMKCTLWEEDVGTMQEGISYRLCNFMVREYASKKFISKPKDGASVAQVQDIGVVTLNDNSEDDETVIYKAQIVAVPQLNKYHACLRCKARVEPCDVPFGRCSREDCGMLQRYDICPSQISAKLLIMTEGKFVTLFAYGKTILELLETENSDSITEEQLLVIPPISSMRYNHENVITSLNV